jgi:predicted nuclease of predicted toxin-antitoxin system
MSLRFFVDHCVPMEVIRRLRQDRHDVSLLRDVLPIRSPDSAVIAKAQELDRILLSLNGDFSDIVSYPPKKYKGIISLQLRNHPEVLPLLLDRLAEYLEVHPTPAEIEHRLFIVEAHRIRIRS